MDYYQTLRNDYIHREMYPQDPMRVDWIPKGPPTGTLKIKAKDRCPPRFVTKIEGNAVEEGVKVFFEGIVDAQPQPKFNWYFNDELIVPGHGGFTEAEVHDSRKMSTLILKYAREHHMGKYSLVASNQLGTAESVCDLIVRKKQFPPVFWQRLYNVSGEKDSSRYVGGVEVGGWPVPEVYWYKVLEDGTEQEVTSKTHTENWNGNPNKYVPSSRVEIRQIDQIRHCVIFQQVSEGDSGLYRVRAVNCLGEAECEAELDFSGLGGEAGDGSLYLPPLWREKRRLTWRDEDQRKKPFVGYNEPELSPEEMEAMKSKSGLVPLGRITEYFAARYPYTPGHEFDNLERLPFKPGVDEHDYRPDRKGGNPSWPGKFKLGKIVHRGYNTDAAGRILPLWCGQADPRARHLADWTWQPVHPDLFVPELPARAATPDPPPVWESNEDIANLVRFLRSLGCSRVIEVEAKNTKKTEIRDAKEPAVNKESQKKSADLSQNVSKFSYTNKNAQQEYSNKKSEQFTQETAAKEVKSTGNVQTIQQEEKVQVQKNVSVADTATAGQSAQETLLVNPDYKADKADTSQSQKLNKFSYTNTSTQQEYTSTRNTSHQEFSSQVQTVYNKLENASFPELEKMSQPPPALPPKTKIMHSPSRNIFSPTESLDSNGTGTASVKTVEFIPVKEKVRMIAAQQEELNRREESSGAASENVKTKGVRILPPSPVTVRKMMVEEELQHYNSAVTRTTPVTMLEQQQTVETKQVSTSLQQEISMDHQLNVPGWGSPAADQLQRLNNSSEKYQIDREFDQLTKESVTTKEAEECRRSFEEAELEALTLESYSAQSYSKQSSRVETVETASVQSFVYQEGSASSSVVADPAAAAPAAQPAVLQPEGRLQRSNSDDRGRLPVRSGPFVRVPDTFTAQPQSAPATPLQQRRRLRINQSPKPTEQESRPRYRDQISGNAFQPGFYRPPAEQSSPAPLFQLLKGRTSSRQTSSSEVITEETVHRLSQASSMAYEGDSES